MSSTRQPGLYGSVITVTVLSAVLLPLRLWARKLSKVGFWWDDWVLIIAWCLALCVSGFAFASAVYGVGRHIEDIQKPKQALKKILFYVYVGEILVHLSICLTMLSVLLLYGRVFAAKQFRRILWALGTFISIWQLGTWPVLIFDCIPVNAVWNTSVHGRCINLKKFYWSLGIPDVILKALLLCLPISFVMRLHMRPAQKAAVIAVFGLGIFDTASGILRLTSFIQLPDSYKEDIPWYYTYVISWTLVETHVGVICACMITLKPLLVILWPQKYSKQGRYTLRPATVRGTGIEDNRFRTRSKGARDATHELPHFDDFEAPELPRGDLERLTLHPDQALSTIARGSGDPAMSSGDIELDEIVLTREVEVSETITC